MTESASPDAPARWSEIFAGRNGLYTFVLGLGMTLFAINTFVVATIMPSVVRDLGGVEFYSWTFSLFSVGAIVGSASAGAMRDALGARRSYAGAGLVLAVGLAGSALASDMPTLVGFRLVQGIGGGALASQAYGLIALLYPERLHSRVLSVISTIWGLATVAGPGYGGVFAAAGHWRGALWSLVAAAIVFAALAWRYVGGGAGHGRLSEIPYWRLGLLAGAVLLLSGASLSPTHGVQVALVAASIALAAIAFAKDARAERNMFPRHITAVFSAVGAPYAILFLVSIVMTFISTYTTFYLQVLHGMSPLTAGYFFAVQSFMWTFGSYFVVAASGRREAAAIAAGLALIVVAAVMLALFAVPGPVAAIGAAIALSGVGIGMMNNPTIQRIIAAASASEKHIAGASVQTVRNIGVSFGAAASGIVAAAAGLADGAPVATVAAAIEWVYWANVVFAVLPLPLVLLLLARVPAR